METVTTHKAKTELSKLLKRAEEGESILVARGNKPVAMIVPPPHAAVHKGRGFGAWKGQVVIPDSFFDPMSAEELRAWEVGAIEPDS
jgi:prevent-host-death family protein